MSKDFDAVAAHYAASERGDLDGMLAPITETTEWVEMAGSSYAGTYIGRAAIVEGVFARIGAEWDGFGFALERLVDGGDAIVAIGNYHGTFKATGRAVNPRVVHVWTMEDGHATRFEQFCDSRILTDAERG